MYYFVFQKFYLRVSSGVLRDNKYNNVCLHKWLSFLSVTLAGYVAQKKNVLMKLQLKCAKR